MKKKKGSEIVKEFLDYLAEADKQWAYAFEKVGEEDKRASDFLHTLELEDLKAPERNKIAKQLQENRKDRRYYKDIVEETDPVLCLINDPQNKKVIDKLKQVLGELRKVEGYHANRTYIPRIEKQRDK